MSVWALQIAAFTAGIRAALFEHGKLTTRTSYFLAWGDQRGVPIQGTNETKPPDAQDDKKNQRETRMTTTDTKHGPTKREDETTGHAYRPTPNRRQTRTTIENKRNHRHAERPTPNELRHFTRSQCAFQRGAYPPFQGEIQSPYRLNGGVPKYANPTSEKTGLLALRKSLD